jgi:hypothetical protein
MNRLRLALAAVPMRRAYILYSACGAFESAVCIAAVSDAVFRDAT